MNKTKRSVYGTVCIKLCLLFILTGANVVTAQVKIGESPENIDTASILELESNTLALVLTRLTSIEMEAIVPLQGAIVYNTTDQCVYYYNGGQWNNLCNSFENISFADNGDGTFTLTLGEGTPITFNGEPETLTTLVNNEDDTYTYTNEAGEEIIIATGGSGGFSLVDNGYGTYTADNGIDPPFTFNGEPETITTLSNNDNGSYTYTSEDGSETQITIGTSGSEHTGTPGSVFFADSDTGTPFEDNENFFWDNVNKRLGIGTNSPTNELEVDGIMRSGRISNSRGTAAFPSYHFTGNFNSGMFSPKPGDMALASAGREVVRVTSGERVGIKVTNPQATLHVGGNLRVDGSIISAGGKTNKSSSSGSLPIRRVSESKVALTETDHTLIVEGTVSLLSLPKAHSGNKGQVFLIKDLGGLPTVFTVPYRNFTNDRSFTTQEQGVLWLQSDGVEWQQIN